MGRYYLYIWCISILFVKVRDFRVIHPIFNFQNTTKINKVVKHIPLNLKINAKVVNNIQNTPINNIKVVKPIQINASDNLQTQSRINHIKKTPFKSLAILRV